MPSYALIVHILGDSSPALPLSAICAIGRVAHLRAIGAVAPAAIAIGAVVPTLAAGAVSLIDSIGAVAYTAATGAVSLTHPAIGAVVFSAPAIGAVVIC